MGVATVTRPSPTDGVTVSRLPPHIQDADRRRHVQTETNAGPGCVSSVRTCTLSYPKGANSTYPVQIFLSSINHAFPVRADDGMPVNGDNSRHATRSEGETMQITHTHDSNAVHIPAIDCSRGNRSDDRAWPRRMRRAALGLLASSIAACGITGTRACKAIGYTAISVRITDAQSGGGIASSAIVTWTVNQMPVDQIIRVGTFPGADTLPVFIPGGGPATYDVSVQRQGYLTSVTRGIVVSAKDDCGVPNSVSVDVRLVK